MAAGRSEDGALRRHLAGADALRDIGERSARLARIALLGTRGRRNGSGVPAVLGRIPMDEQTKLKSHFSVYDNVTDKIIQAIRKGAGMYVMPWHGGSPPNSIPMNASSNAPYRGVNILALWAEAFVQGYSSGNWASYRQWQELGAQVRQGEHGTVVVFFKSIGAPNDEDAKEKQPAARRVARAYRVFNAAQVDGWDDPPPARIPEFFGLRDADSF